MTLFCCDEMSILFNRPVTTCSEEDVESVGLLRSSCDSASLDSLVKDEGLTRRSVTMTTASLSGSVASRCLACCRGAMGCVRSSDRFSENNVKSQIFSCFEAKSTCQISVNILNKSELLIIDF